MAIICVRCGRKILWSAIVQHKCIGVMPKLEPAEGLSYQPPAIAKFRRG